MTSLQDFLNSILLAMVALIHDDDAHPVAGFARNLVDSCTEENVNAFIGEQGAKSVAYVGVFSGHQARVAIDDRDFAAEAAHRLSHFHSDVAAADNQQVFGNFIEFKSFDMGERLRFDKARNWIESGTRACTNDHIRSPQLPCGAIGESNFHGSRSEEAACA